MYNSQGIIGFVQSGVTYTYRKNLFGYITAIYRGATKVAEYKYDAWGNCVVVDPATGLANTSIEFIGNQNPFRYRGYYWDNDLQLYYLMSRYYDPQTGRFINADSLEYLDPETIGGLNLYAYCGNNPVMSIDPMGTAWWHWALAGVAVAALAVMTFVTAGSATAGMIALTLAANGVASATAAITIFAFATIGSACALTASAVVATINSIGTLVEGQPFSEAVNEFMNYGEEALNNTLTFGLIGAGGGFYAYNSQIGNPSQAGFMTKAQRAQQRRWIHANYPEEVWKGKHISHIYGTYGENRNIFIFQTPADHRAFHKEFGYKTFGGPFNRKNPYQLNVWDYISRLLGR